MTRSIADAGATGALACCALFLCAVIGPQARADDAAPPLLIAFHIDVLGHQLAGDTADSDITGDKAGLPSPRAMEFNLVGLPVKLGMKDDGPDARMGLKAGFQGDYELALTERLTFTASGAVAKTGYLDNSWGSDEATAATALHYRHDGLLLALEPAWRLNMMETAVTDRTYGATARFAKSLPRGVDISGGLRYGRYDSWSDADDYATATAFAGLSYRLAGRLKLDLFYNTTYELPDNLRPGDLSFDDLGAAANSTGPTVTMSFPLSDALDIAASYRYCRSTDALPQNGGERDIDDMQSLDISAAWHSDDPAFNAVNLTAAYGYDRLSTTGRDADTQSHAATIALVMPF